jgi:hypothetical protein
MAGRSAVNTGNACAIMLLELKRHFAMCDACRGAIKVNDTATMCPWALRKIIAVARAWDSNIALRLKAKRSGDPFVYRCPDLSKHSEAYAMTAEPLMVTGVQDRLI